LPAPEVYQVFPDLDHGLEQCENTLLRETGGDLEVDAFDSPLEEAFLSSRDREAVLAYFERVETRAGETLIAQGDPADALYLLERGQLTARLETNGQQLRLRTFQAGAIVGEIGLILGGERTADVVADEALTPQPCRPGPDADRESRPRRDFS